MAATGQLRIFEGVTPETSPEDLPSADNGKKKIPSDFPEYCTLVSETFAFKGYIDLCEHRAMTLQQIKDVNQFAAVNCQYWKEVTTWQNAKGEWVKGSPKFGKTPSMVWLNLYVMNAWVTMPSTKEHNCSFVELCAGGDQPPDWFCSHWWGECVKDFGESLASHSRVRKLLASAAYWVCAYANRQWDIASGGISADPKDTSFYKAMGIAKKKGGTLVLLDEEAKAFTRIWCAFEESITLDEGLKLDIATVYNHGAHVITDGFAASDDGKAWKKSHREQSFPLHVIETGMQLELEKAESTVAADRRHILNSLAGSVSFDDEPPSTHENYNKVKSQLRATFALAAWRQARDQGFVDDLKLHSVLSADIWRESISLDFGHPTTNGPEFNDNELILLAGSFPPSLKSFDLDLAGCRDIGIAGFRALFEGLTDQLQSLRLHLAECWQINDSIVQSWAGLLPRSIKTLDLCFACNSFLGHAGLSVLVGEFPAGLQTLRLDLRKCANIKDTGIAALAKALGGTSKQLSELTLDVTKNKQITSSGLRAFGDNLPDRITVLHIHHDDGDFTTLASLRTLKVDTEQAVGVKSGCCVAM